MRGSELQKYCSVSDSGGMRSLMAVSLTRKSHLRGLDLMRLSNFFAWTLFSMLCALAVALNWRTLAATFSLALQREEFTHILLIFPLSLALISMEWKSPRKGLNRGWVSGMLLLVVAAGIFIFARLASIALDLQRSLGMFAFVTSCIGVFVLCFGGDVSRNSVFPLCFLYLAVPLPAAALARVTQFLQHGSAIGAYSLFTVAGIPVAQDKLLLTIPGLTVEVARECSSIRSSMMLLVTTMFLGQLLLNSALHKTLLTLIAIPLSVAKNSLRIFTIAMLGTKVDPAFLTGKLHRQGGGLFFAIALLLVLLVLYVFRRRERRLQDISAAPALAGTTLSFS